MANMSHDYPSGNSRKADRSEERAVRLGRSLKRAYTLARRSYDLERTGVRSRYNPPSKFQDPPDRNGHESGINTVDCLWVKYALTLYRNGYDPAEFVERAFIALLGKDVPPLRIEDLLSDRAVKLYLLSSGDAVENAKISYQCERDIVRDRQCRASTVTEEDRTSEMLTDPGLGLSPLFRYCFASAVDGKVFERIAACFRLRAVVQYARMKQAYDQVYGEFIPKEFRDSACQEYQQLLLREDRRG